MGRADGAILCGDAVSLYPIRPVCENDHAWILDSWSKSNAQSRMAADAGALYMGEQKRLILRILYSPQTVALMAHTPNDPDALLGYAVGRRSPEHTVYYVYVRATLRRQRLACALLSNMLDIPEEELRCKRVQFSHKPMVPSMKAPPPWVFNPYRNLDADVPEKMLRNAS